MRETTMSETQSQHVLLWVIICTDLVLLVVCEVGLQAVFLETGILLHKEETILQIMTEAETIIIGGPKQTTETINQEINKHSL